MSTLSESTLLRGTDREIGVHIGTTVGLSRQSKPHENQARTRKSLNQSGFTLIEVMIAVAIVAILAAIAYPSYQNQVRRSWRANAESCLMDLAQGMERRFTASFSYAFADATARDNFLNAACTQEGNMAARYTFNFPADPTAGAFTLRAVPVAAGPQGADTCGTLTLDQASVKGSAGTVSECWRR